MASQRLPSSMGRPASRSGSALPSSARLPSAARPPSAAMRVRTGVRRSSKIILKGTREFQSLTFIMILKPDGSRYKYEGWRLHPHCWSPVSSNQSDRETCNPAGPQWDEDCYERYIWHTFSTWITFQTWNPAFQTALLFLKDLRDRSRIKRTSLAFWGSPAGWRVPTF